MRAQAEAAVLDAWPHATKKFVKASLDGAKTYLLRASRRDAALVTGAAAVRRAAEEMMKDRAVYSAHS